MRRVTGIESTIMKSQGVAIPPYFQYGNKQRLLATICFTQYRRIDLGKGRSEYRGPLPKALASCGGMTSAPKAPGEQLTISKPRGMGWEKGGSRLRLLLHGVGGWGGGTSDPLLSSGKRLLKTERDLAMAHGPRNGQGVSVGIGISMGDVRKVINANANTTRRAKRIPTGRLMMN